jgi:hypothetical protein
MSGWSTASVGDPDTAYPRYRGIVAVDIEASTTANNAAKANQRRTMYRVFEQAFLQAGISPRSWLDFDRGDGVLRLIRPVDRVPKPLLLNPVMPTLSDLLAGHHAEHPEQRFRLRAVVHAGEVCYDRTGVFGEALDVSFRLLDAPEVKRKLSDTAAPLVLVASEDIYQTVIRQGYGGIDAGTFEPLVRVRIAGREHRGWVTVPRPR